MASSTQSGTDTYIEQHINSSLEDLRRLCAVPSVAAQGRGVDECAELVAEMLRARGFEARIMPVPAAPPAVYAERIVRPDAPTILFYNHYDVQPAEPLELWESPPFEPTIRDGSFYARGAGDDKGHIVCRLAAIDALLATHGALPCNVKFLIEGGEEISSPGLPTFVRDNKELLAADACLWEFGGVDYDGRPQITLGMRGICYVELRVRTASQDVHSGLGGSIFPNAAWRLVWALGTLKGPDERIRIPGYYDSVRQPSSRDMELLAALPSREEELKETYSLNGFVTSSTGVEFQRAAVWEPTCTICGLTTGYQGEGSKTVLPAYASAKVDFRLAPDQTPEEVVEKLRAHLDAQGFKDVEIAFLGGEAPAKLDGDDPFIQMTIRTAEEVYGKPPVIAPLIGGSGPMHAFLEHVRLPVSNAGVGYPGGLAHAPNEHIRIQDFILGAKHTARVMEELGRM